MVETTLAVGQDERAALVARIKLISWLSLAWMTAEGLIGTTAGLVANSIALIGYGVDSTITGVASLIIIWRFTGTRLSSDNAEQQAQKVVAITFFLLAPYIIVAAVHHLVTGSHAQASWVGISLAIISVTLMPMFGHAKKRIGVELHSSATTGEGSQNILCAYLSLAILVGLAANAILGLWWADPLVALIVATVALQTGINTWRGESATTAPAIEGSPGERDTVAASPGTPPGEAAGIERPYSDASTRACPSGRRTRRRTRCR
jgi:divalent metal cation (Fe/Co/Zn/Cd) transporter